MADRKISDLTALTAQASGDLIPIVDVSEAAAADKNKSITIQELFRGIPVRVGIGTATPATNTSNNANSLVIGDNSSATETGMTLGSTTASTIRFNDGADAGFIEYGHASNYLRFVVNTSTEAIRIDSSGRVGIGTSTARAGLTVALGGDAIPAAGASTGSALFGNATDDGVYGVVLGANTSGIGYIQAQRGDGTATTYDLAIQPNGGNVGIGTASAGAQLHVQGSGDEVFRINTTNAGGPYCAFQTNGTNFLFLGSAAQLASGGATDSCIRSQNNLILTSGGATERARIDSSGRLLVGTTTSTSVAGFGETKIQSRGNYESSITVINTEDNANTSGLIVGKVRGTSIVQNNDPIGGLYFQGYDGSAFRVGSSILGYVDGTPGASDMPTRLQFATTADGAASPTTRVQILANGATKISTSSAYWSASQLHEMWNTLTDGVICQMTHESNTSPYGLAIVFGYASPDNNTNYFLTCNDSTAVRTRIYSDGDVWTSDAGTLTSDVTLKRDITDASPKLADVMKLRVRNFYWQEDYHPNKQDKKLIGFVAQEFEEVFPGLVSEHVIKGGDPVRDEDGNETGEKTPEVFKKGIKEAKLVPILVKALQEAVERIETLEAKVAALEAS